MLLHSTGSGGHRTTDAPGHQFSVIDVLFRWDRGSCIGCRAVAEAASLNSRAI